MMLMEDHQLLIVINSYPENNKLYNKLKKTVPGNTTYSDIVNKGRKVKIFHQ